MMRVIHNPVSLYLSNYVSLRKRYPTASLSTRLQKLVMLRYSRLIAAVSAMPVGALECCKNLDRRTCAGWSKISPSGKWAKGTRKPPLGPDLTGSGSLALTTE